MRIGKLFPCRKKNESQLLPHTIQQQFEMDHKTKYKSKNQKTSIKKNGYIHLQPGQNTKSTNHERKKINKLDITKIKTVCSPKSPLKIFRQITDRRKIFAVHKPDKGPIFLGITGQFIMNYYKSTSRKLTPLKDLHRHSSEDLRMGNNHRKRYATLLVPEKTQIKTVRRNLFTSIRMAKI